MKETTYNDAYLRMAILGDALQLPPAQKALSEVLMLRAHYGKAQKDFEAAKKQIAEDAAQGKDAKKDKRLLTPLLRTPSRPRRPRLPVSPTAALVRRPLRSFAARLPRLATSAPGCGLRRMIRESRRPERYQRWCGSK